MGRKSTPTQSDRVGDRQTPGGMKGFLVLARRWAVERTFAWLSFHHQLSKDYEYLPETSEAFIRIAMIRLMLARLS